MGLIQRKILHEQSLLQINLKAVKELPSLELLKDTKSESLQKGKLYLHQKALILLTKLVGVTPEQYRTRISTEQENA